MEVGSWLELYTTLYGWSWYNILWDVLVTTGIVYIPFLAIIFENILKPYTSQETKEASITSVRRMEADLIVTITILVLAALPMPAYFNVNSGNLFYNPPTTPVTTPSAPTQNAATNDSTYDTNGFNTATGISTGVPLLWYSVMALSSGINSAVITGTGTPTQNIRAMMIATQGAGIEDQALRQEANDFFSQCFIPARSKYVTEKPSSPALTTILNNFGTDDTEWLGSHVFMSLVGYYASTATYKGFRAAAPVEDYPLDTAARDFEYAGLPGGTPLPAWGRPYCDQWWNPAVSTSPGATGAAQGLRQKLIDESGSVAAWITALFGPTTFPVEGDAAAKAVLSNAPQNFSPSTYAEANTYNQDDGSFFSMLTTAGKGVIGEIGVNIASMVMQFAMHIILMGLPMIQALLLLAVYAMLPILLVFSRYSIKFVVLAVIGIFVIKFWSVLWHWAMVLDNSLIYAMLPDSNKLLNFITSPDSDKLIKRVLLDILTTSMYMGMPLLFSSFMAWAGISAARYINSAVSSISQPMNQAGATAGAMPGKAAGVVKQIAMKGK